MLAGVLLKMGTYGMVRFCLPLFPEAAHRLAPYIAVLAIIGIIYGALVAMVQTDLKRLVAYSSVSHLGFVVLGIFAFTPTALQGAVYQMLNHGISTGALFLLVGMLYDRRHTHLISEYGGLATPMPVLAALYLFVSLSSAGLPMLNGFVGEFLILAGTFERHAAWASLGRARRHFLRRSICCGPTSAFSSARSRRSAIARCRIADMRERGVLFVMAALILWMGIGSAALHAPHRRPPRATCIELMQRPQAYNARATSAAGPAACRSRNGGSLNVPAARRSFAAGARDRALRLRACCSCWSSRFSRTRGAACSFSWPPRAPRWRWPQRSIRRLHPGTAYSGLLRIDGFSLFVHWWSGWWRSWSFSARPTIWSANTSSTANTARWSCLPRPAWA